MASLKEKYKKIPVQIKASFWFVICSFLQRGISVITTPIFTRLLNTHSYGQYGVFNSWLDIISVIVTIRLYYGVFVQGLVKNDHDKARYTSSLQGLCTVLCTAWLIIYLVAHEFFNKLLGLTTVQMLAMLIMIWSTGVFRFWTAEQKNEYKYRTLVIITIIVSILKPLVGVILVVNSEDKVTARILGLALVELAGYSWLFVLHMYKGKQFFSKKYWKHALAFNIPLIPHYLSQTVLNSSDRIMIKKLTGPSEAGIYTVAYSIASIMVIFNQALISTIQPWMYQKIKANRYKDIASVVYAVLAAIAVIDLALIALAPEVIAVFAPASYKKAIWVIPSVTMGVFFLFAYHMFATVSFYFEKTKFVMVASSVAAILNIILNYIFIPRFGFLAAGYTTLVCYLVYTSCHYFLMAKVCDKELNGDRVYDMRIISLIFISFMVTGFVMMATYNYTIIRYSLILLGLVAMFIKRKTIIGFIARLMSLKKKKQ